MAKSSEQIYHDEVCAPVAKREVILKRTSMMIEGKDILANLVIKYETVDFSQHEFANLNWNAFVNPIVSKFADTFLNYRETASPWKSFLPF